MSAPKFEFIPGEFGFRPISEFPDVAETLMECMNPRRFRWTYIKISAIGGEEFGFPDRVVLWYTLCDTEDAGEFGRITFYRHSFDSRKRRVDPEYLGPTKQYFGTIKSREFAYLLMDNLCGDEWRKDLNREAKRALKEVNQAVPA